MPKARRYKTEQQHQEALVKWFRLQYPKYKDFLTIASFGEDIGALRMGQLKYMGLTPGYPDLGLFIPIMKQVKKSKKWYHIFSCEPKQYDFYGAMFIEMKSKLGTVAKHQKKIHNQLKKMGYEVVVAYDWEDAQKAIKEYLRHVY